MSLVLEALKRAQRIRTERKARRFSTNIPWFSQWRTKRFFRVKFLILILTPLLISLLIVSFNLGIHQKRSKRVTPPESFPILKEISIDSMAERSASAPLPKIEQTKEGPPKKTKIVSKPAFEKPQPSRPEGQKVAKEEKASTKPISEQRPPVPQEKAGERELKIQTVPTKEAMTHFSLGLLYHKNNKPHEASEEYKKAIQIDPLNVGAHNNLGMVYKELGRLEEAISQYQKVLSIDPKYDKARHNLAVAFYFQGDLERAALEFYLAIESNPRRPESYNNLGLLYRKQKRFSEAKGVFQKGLSIAPNYPPLHYNFALTLEEEGDLKGAVLHYQKFVELSPEDQRVLLTKVKRHLEALSYER